MAFFFRAYISAYHDVSIANVSKPRRELKHLLVFSADLRKVATEATENNIGKMLDIRPATGRKRSDAHGPEKPSTGALKQVPKQQSILI
jgi:hypothetical protein